MVTERLARNNRRTKRSAFRLKKPFPPGEITKNAQGLRQVVNSHDAVAGGHDVVAAEALKDHSTDAVSLSHLAAVVEWSDDAIFSSTLDGVILSWNRGAEKILGYTALEIVGHMVDILIPSESPDELPEMLARLRQGNRIVHHETTWQRNDGRRVDISFTALPISDSSGAIVAASAICRDISEKRTDESLRKRVEEAIRLLNIDLAHKAYHDALTDLPNRVLFVDQLRQALARARRTHTRVAVLLLDLNHFKQINDTLGHYAGDTVLVEIARRLRAAIREADTVARWGGDEFTIILNDVGKQKATVHAISRIMATFNAPVMLPDRKATVTVKIGIALFPTDGQNPDDLIRRADHAMYHAQGGGKNVFAFSGRVAKGRSQSSQRNRDRK